VPPLDEHFTDPEALKSLYKHVVGIDDANAVERGILSLYNAECIRGPDSVLDTRKLPTRNGVLDIVFVRMVLFHMSEDINVYELLSKPIDEVKILLDLPDCDASRFAYYRIHVLKR
jgi:hypothetical protein